MQQGVVGPTRALGRCGEDSVSVDGAPHTLGSILNVLNQNPPILHL